ncbi:Rieske (2Fe-2S) protein [Mastigocladopsis repens]|uniref:Rieske (2Fe-2S) protein n=1 Tax=Mastigocladopsis repens TaxID=221287 RepID=UPI0008FBDA85
MSSVSSDYTSEGITFKFKGNKYLVPAACPHRGGKLYCGLINEKNGTITCPLHFSKFEITSGKLLSGPSSASLEIIEIAQD